jgi:tetratricopeptide (TPR) repeat protein
MREAVIRRSTLWAPTGPGAGLASAARAAGAFGLALALASGAAAQYREYYLRGKVVDPQQVPVAGVEVRLRDKATSRSYSFKTDEEGGFKFAGLPRGVYEVTFSREGYAPKKDEWRFEAPQDRMQRVDLPDVVLVSQARVNEIQELKATEAAVAEAAERLRQGDTAAAVASLSELVARKPGDANAQFLLGLGYARQQKYAEAKGPLTRVTELSPGFAGAWLELAGCQRRLGERDAALEAYEKALALDATNADAAYNAGLLLFEAGRTDEALARFEQGLASKPADPDLLDMAGRCHIQKQQLDRAVELLEKARAASSDPAKIAFLDELVRKIKPLQGP